MISVRSEVQVFPGPPFQQARDRVLAPGADGLDPGAVAQLGEHLLCKQGVAGSIPVSSTITVTGDGGPAATGERRQPRSRGQRVRSRGQSFRSNDPTAAMPDGFRFSRCWTLWIGNVADRGLGLFVIRGRRCALSRASKAAANMPMVSLRTNAETLKLRKLKHTGLCLCARQFQRL